MAQNPQSQDQPGTTLDYRSRPFIRMALLLGVTLIASIFAIFVKWQLVLVGLAYFAFVAKHAWDNRFWTEKAEDVATGDGAQQAPEPVEHSLTESFARFCDESRFIAWELYVPVFYIALVIIVRAVLNAHPQY